MAIRAVVFDLFDTLVDLSMRDLPRVEIGGRWVPSTADALHEVVADYASVERAHFIAVLTEVDRAFRETRHARGLELPTLERFEAVVDRLGIDAPELPNLLTQTHMGMIRDQVSIPEHHEKILGDLARRARLGLCSNFSHSAMALSLLDDCGFRPHLDALAISDAVGIRKPRPEIFEAVLAELGVAPEEALHVGDSLSADVGGAAPLGIRTAWITRRIADPEAALRAHDGAKPDCVIEDLCEVEGLLDGA
ncbi:MAG: HAD family hydrolase [Deltaproteobacteria bacterium]|jgi:HAD superfamily hydrolase (TIGR01509 family)|nr:HAD family hydrolase [Deltaproteobacteria bacterium]MBW2542272.1 HAD family hydrolase [Deltaproteobacteria bacterium]